jgi:hypothetical protein
MFLKKLDDAVSLPVVVVSSVDGVGISTRWTRSGGFLSTSRHENEREKQSFISELVVIV